jgi:protein CpxP
MTKFAENKVKRTAAMLLCSVALVLPALAQSGGVNTPSAQDPQAQVPPDGAGPGGPGGRRGGPERRLQMLQHELNLTPDQSAKVKTILDEGRAQMMTQRDSSASPEDRRAKMMDNMQVENSKIKAVLTDDQKTKFDAMEARMRERRGHGGNGDGGAPPPPPPPPQ